jgi:hypothetical protein
VVRLGERDRRRYETAVAAAVPAVERGLSHGVIANRARPHSAGFTLEPFVNARRRYARSVAETPDSGSLRAAFIGDVHDCYGSIGPQVVSRSLRTLRVPDEAVQRIDEILRAFHSLGVRGLPIGPEASAVLANAVLAPVDLAIAAAAAGPVFRWVDDVIAFSPDVAGARRAERAFARALEELGLASHPGKCTVVDARDELRSGASSPSPAGPSARGMMRAP